LKKKIVACFEIVNNPKQLNKLCTLSSLQWKKYVNKQIWKQVKKPHHQDKKLMSKQINMEKRFKARPLVPRLSLPCSLAPDTQLNSLPFCNTGIYHRPVKESSCGTSLDQRC
jgi:hypothetical protein